MIYLITILKRWEKEGRGNAELRLQGTELTGEKYFKNNINSFTHPCSLSKKVSSVLL